jgi:uncharacterized membrane protein YuzA (DUF378 family)
MPNQMAARPPVDDSPKKKNIELPSPPKKNEVKMEDVSEYENIYDWIIIAISAIAVEAVVILLVRYFPDVFGKIMNIWFNRFKMSAVLVDVLTIMIGFGITRYVYSEYVYPRYDWNPIYFTGLSAIVQAVYVSLFYFVVVRPSAQGQNTMLDVLREIVATTGWRILGVDVMKIVATVFGSMILKATPLHITSVIGMASLYVIPFALESKNLFSNIA